MQLHQFGSLVNRQLYQINTDSKILIEEYSKRFEDFALGELALPNPLPERPLSPREMKPEEIPTDEASYWRACDSFVGGDAFIRIAGPIVWLEDAKKPKCKCGARFVYLAAIGYELPDAPTGILGKQAFFIGEGALYFFLCPVCKKILVLSQSS